MLVKVLQEAKTIKYVIYNDLNDKPKDEDLETLKGFNITPLGVEELRRMGGFHPTNPIPHSSDDLCCIMYTSGSSGPPKGVPLKHCNIVAAVAGGTSIVGDYLGPGDVLLTYLPLTHIF